ncbi:hypothetical protein BDA96_10G207300 [Sorghum bicolor]|uniref:Uncharacterized protein n=1 Tax=Sorghum bicolor TaxID=4558 RepID=A0A921Q3L4_SORBI|nr:hypothetical protein BDA96_10G207300 [Sorghum bicolor]
MVFPHRCFRLCGESCCWTRLCKSFSIFIEKNITRKHLYKREQSPSCVHIPHLRRSRSLALPLLPPFDLVETPAAAAAACSPFVALLPSRTPYSFSRRGSRCQTPTLNISLSSSSAFCSSY